jgi:hypothetical protein
MTAELPVSVPDSIREYEPGERGGPKTAVRSYELVPQVAMLMTRGTFPYASVRIPNESDGDTKAPHGGAL